MRDTASSNVVFSFKDSPGAPGCLRSGLGFSVNAHLLCGPGERFRVLPGLFCLLPIFLSADPHHIEILSLHHTRQRASGKPPIGGGTRKNPVTALNRSHLSLLYHRSEVQCPTS